MAIAVTVGGNHMDEVNVSWDFEDMAKCGSSELYKYIISLKEGASTIDEIIAYTSGSHTFFTVPSGQYQVQITSEYEDSETWIHCHTSLSDNFTVTPLYYCIPSDATDISFSKLATFYSLSSTNISLSGPDDPSSGETIFAKSDLPLTGSPSKSRPNAVSELRGDCGGVTHFDPSKITTVYLEEIHSGSVDLKIDRKDYVGRIRVYVNLYVECVVNTSDSNDNFMRIKATSGATTVEEIEAKIIANTTGKDTSSATAVFDSDIHDDTDCNLSIGWAVSSDNYVKGTISINSVTMDDDYIIGEPSVYESSLQL